MKMQVFLGVSVDQSEKKQNVSGVRIMAESQGHLHQMTKKEKYRYNYFFH